jgi:hypothetical protein
VTYKTKEQQVVVESRIAKGYESQKLPNGDWLVWKGRHTMQINCLGYDCYVPKGNLK